MVLTLKSFLLMFLGAAGLVGCLILLWPHVDESNSEKTLKVLSHGWKRTLQVEEYSTVNATAWEGELPKGAAVTEQRMESRRKHIVQQRKDAKRGSVVDDYYSESKQLRYYYTITRWNPGALLTEQGEDLNPISPTLKPNVRSERKGKTSEVYFLRLEDQQANPYVFTTDTESEWRGYVDGSSYQATLAGNAVHTLRKN